MPVPGAAGDPFSPPTWPSDAGFSVAASRGSGAGAPRYGGVDYNAGKTDSRDPFAAYAQRNYAPDLSSLDPTQAQFLRAPANAQSAYSYATNSLGNNPNLAGGQRLFAQNRFNHVYSNYLADSNAAQARGEATPNFYDYSRNYNFGQDYQNLTPMERGFSVGSSAPMGRFQRSY